MTESERREFERWLDQVYRQMRQERGDHEEIEF